MSGLGSWSPISLKPFCISFSCLPLTIANSQGWVLAQDGARRACSTIFFSISIETGSGLKARTLFLSLMAATTSMSWSSFSHFMANSFIVRPILLMLTFKPTMADTQRSRDRYQTLLARTLNIIIFMSKTIHLSQKLYSIITC